MGCAGFTVINPLIICDMVCCFLGILLSPVAKYFSEATLWIQSSSWARLRSKSFPVLVSGETTIYVYILSSYYTGIFPFSSRPYNHWGWRRGHSKLHCLSVISAYRGRIPRILDIWETKDSMVLRDVIFRPSALYMPAYRP